MKNSLSKGFTLIELLVVFTLATVIGGIGLAAFSSYNSQQEINQKAQLVKQSLDQVKHNTLAGARPPDAAAAAVNTSFCRILQGYRLDMTTNIIYTTPVCILYSTNAPGEVGPTGNSWHVTLDIPSKFKQANFIQGCTNIMFYTLTNYVECLSGSAFDSGILSVITLNNGNGLTKTISILKDGTIQSQ